MKTVTVRSYPNLRLWRNDRKWSQQEAAEYLGISQTAYSRLERGVVATSGRRAKVIRDKTGVPLDVLVGAVEF